MFPNEFLFGAATSSHQVEGNNIYNDWWQWEKNGRVKESSGPAVRHYEFFDDDFKLAAELNHNAHRFSIEWSRIEPKEGAFSEAEIEHYQSVIVSLRKYRIEPIVTLHHFTNPFWFANKGGWLSAKASFYFTRYVEKIVTALGREIRFWVTINEPEVYTYQSYLAGLWPPGEKSALKSLHVLNNMARAHKAAYRKIHRVYRSQNWPACQVSVAKNLMIFRPCPFSQHPMMYFAIFLRNRYFNNYFFRKVGRSMDFIGLNYYAREFVTVDKIFEPGIVGAKCSKVHGHVKHVNAMGWDSYPEGLYTLLLQLKKFRRPIIITENGTCETDDKLRSNFITEHLAMVEKAIRHNVPVIGYLYWSLLDNFEWHHGFKPKFGLTEVNYQTFKRTPRESARKFAEICRTHKV